MAKLKPNQFTYTDVLTHKKVPHGATVLVHNHVKEGPVKAILYYTDAIYAVFDFSVDDTGTNRGYSDYVSIGGKKTSFRSMWCMEAREYVELATTTVRQAVDNYLLHGMDFVMPDGAMK